MPSTRLKVALNAIQWINLSSDPDDPDSPTLWLYGDPDFVRDYPRVLGEVKEAGFDAVMMEVLATQTLQSYQRMVQNADLQVAPGYSMVRLPEDHGLDIKPGSHEWIRWFDPIRRKAEETNFFGLSTVFIGPEMGWGPALTRVQKAAAVGLDFDQDRLDRVVEATAYACEIYKQEGIRPGLHNHVGTWIETREEIDHVLGSIDDSLLGASFDIGHLEWAGIDAVEMLTSYRDRLVDLHFKDLRLDIARESRENPGPYLKWSNRGLFVEPGLGQVDLRAILGALPEGFPGWVIIEVDRATMEPLESAKYTAGWLKSNVPTF